MKNLKKKTTFLMKVKIVENFLLKSWWLFIFLIGCYLFYEQGLRRRADDFSRLQRQYLDLQNEKALASTERDHLLLQINSQSDPEWIELTLIKGLGLVQEGKVKVLFTDQQELLQAYKN